MKTKSKLKYLIISLALIFIVSCSSKSQSLEITKVIKEDIKQTEQKIIKIENNYKKLIVEQPSCEVETIIDNVEYVKSDMSSLRGKIEATEVIIKAEVKSYQKEIRCLKLINYVLAVVIIFMAVVIVGKI